MPSMIWCQVLLFSTTFSVQVVSFFCYLPRLCWPALVWTDSKNSKILKYEVQQCSDVHHFSSPVSQQFWPTWWTIQKSHIRKRKLITLRIICTTAVLLLRIEPSNLVQSTNSTKRSEYDYTRSIIAVPPHHWTLLWVWIKRRNSVASAAVGWLKTYISNWQAVVSPSIYSYSI